MTSVLPINVLDLVNGRTESVRVEFKASWDEHTTGPQVLTTVCAFANDFQNLNGGYVVIGVRDAETGEDERVAGLGAEAIDKAQRWIRGRCKAMRPSYAPVLSPEKLEGKDVLVVWAPASQSRPHRAPEGKGDWKYWIRVGSETADAQANGQLTALLAQAAPIPWDNQVAPAAQVEDLREGMVREYLHDARSALREQRDAATVYRHLQITSRVNNHEAPRNVGLLFFSDDPQQWFPGARIVVARFAADSAGRVQDEFVFRGPLAGQLRNCLRHLEGISRSHIQKQRERSQVRGWVNFPVPALREALVNAVFHRSYRPDVMEPTKVCLYPDRVEVISYPGPVPGIEAHHLARDASVPPVPNRNPRIGEFLKTLDLAEGYRTGLPAIYRVMEENGSPAPEFDFGADWFRVTLPAHPEYAAVSALEDAAYLRTVGGEDDAFRRIQEAWRANVGSAALTMELVRLLAAQEDLERAAEVFERFRAEASPAAAESVTNTWVEILIDHGRGTKARSLLEAQGTEPTPKDATLAHSSRQSRRLEPNSRDHSRRT